MTSRGGFLIWCVCPSLVHFRLLCTFGPLVTLMPPPPVIGRWLREANDGLGTRLIAAAPTEVEETIRIDGLPTRVKFSPGTTLGGIEALRSVLGEMEPGLVSDLVHTTFMLNPTLRAVLIHLNSADVTSLLAGILRHVPKPKDKAKGKAPVGPRRMWVIGLERMWTIVWFSQAPSRAPRRWHVVPLEVPQLVTRSVYCRPPRWTPFRFGVWQPIPDLPLRIRWRALPPHPIWRGKLWHYRSNVRCHGLGWETHPRLMHCAPGPPSTKTQTNWMGHDCRALSDRRLLAVPDGRVVVCGVSSTLVCQAFVKCSSGGGLLEFAVGYQDEFNSRFSSCVGEWIILSLSCNTPFGSANCWFS